MKVILKPSLIISVLVSVFIAYFVWGLYYKSINYMLRYKNDDILIITMTMSNTIVTDIQTETKFMIYDASNLDGADIDIYFNKSMSAWVIDDFRNDKYYYNGSNSLNESISEIIVIDNRVTCSLPRNILYVLLNQVNFKWYSTNENITLEKIE